ncbi:MAG: hypothetical protein ACLTYW_09160 [Collinsella sp.]
MGRLRVWRASFPISTATQPAVSAHPLGYPRQASVVNAHPHTSCDGRIAIVHNGIIENFAELREELEGRGHTLRARPIRRSSRI